MSVMAPAQTSIEILRCQPVSGRAQQLFDALAVGASRLDLPVTVSDTYRGDSSWLVLWGPGAPNRFDAMRRQVAAGGHVIAWDLAYWDRLAKVRVSIDAAHPREWVLRKNWPRDRFLADGVTVTDGCDATGPIIVAGLGRKARVQYGEDRILVWETAMLRACESRWSRPIWYRRKQDDAPVPPGAVLAPSGSIERVLTSGGR